MYPLTIYGALSPLSAVRKLSLLPNFQKGGKLDRTSTLTKGLMEKRHNFFQEVAIFATKKLKSEIFNSKKGL